MSKIERDERKPKTLDERDDDSELVAPPLSLVALFLVPILLLMIWAMTQG